MKRLYVIWILLFTLLFVGLKISAQVNSMAFPSANNTFLGKQIPNTNIGVDLYTGTLQLGVPVCNLASKSLSIPISLNYIDGRGVRVQEYAGPVGLGWQLNAGGSVSRVVRGFPDEQPNGYLGNGSLPSGAIGTGGQWGKVVVNNINNNVALTGSQRDAIMGSNYGLNLPTADGEPDIYYVKTPLFGFQFTFDENGNPVFSNSTGFQIIAKNFYNSSNYGNSSFEVIDPQGNQYYFGSSSQSVEQTSDSLYNQPYTFPTTWYLDKIITYNAGDVINLNYSAFTSADITYHYSYSAVVDIYGVKKDAFTTTQTKILNPKQVTSIVSSLGEVDFTYATDRKDDASAARLATISLKEYNNASNPIKNYTFNYSYFNGGSTDINLLRLKLNNITLAGNTSNTSAPVTFKSFTYNEGINLPSRQSLSVIDYFGYFSSLNGGTNTYSQTIPPNATYAAANILTSVKDITGGTSNFYYELNDYYNASASTTTPVGGLRVNKISNTLPSGDVLSTQYAYTDNAGKSTGQILSNSYLINIIQACNNTKTFSESPSNFYDLNGNYVGYSSVKVVAQNGGYSISKFSNFSDYADILNYSNGSGIPDITSSVSFAYKRGLLLSNAIYNSSGNIISEDIIPLSAYHSLTSPIVKKAWGYHWANIAVAGNTYSCSFGASSTYWTNVENFRLVQSVHKEYDQLNPANYVQTTTNYTYGSNNRSIRSIATTNSKGQTITKTNYYAGDIADPAVTNAGGIPMLTSSEQSAVNSMVTAGDSDAVVHQTVNSNGATSQTHNSYASTNTGIATKNFLNTTSIYKGNSLIKQQNFNYDPETANAISSNLTLGKSSAVQYGYNNSFPVANVSNASSTCTYSAQQTTGTTNMTPPYFIPGPGTLSFTAGYAGTVTLTINGSGSNTCSISGNISGPTYNNFSLYYNGSSSSTTVYVVPGTYTITANASCSGGTSTPWLSITYPMLSTTKSFSNEFFYEGFEDNPYAASGGAHTGNNYMNGNYTVYYTPVNSRSYIIQWWSLVNGAWQFNEKPYSANMSLTGPVDDIRVFPSDALMTSYTYSPQIGKTGEIDPSGRTTTYEYDGLGRPSVVRDNDKNIVSKKYYAYAGQPISGDGLTYVNAQVSQTFKKNNCSAGYDGSYVNYIVGAGKYSSAISQADANQQAQSDLNTNGQNFANINGTCTALARISGSLTFTSINQTGNTSFTVVKAGTLIIHPNYGGDPGQTYSVSYNLSGASTASGSYCVYRGGTGASCTSTTSDITINISPGTYTLSGTLTSSTNTSPYGTLNFDYPGAGN